MNYQEQLSPWVIHKRLPNLHRVTVARFRQRSDAEAYLKLVNRMLPQAQFDIVFEAAQTEEPTGLVTGSR